MKPLHTFSVILIFSLIAVCLARPFNDDEKKKLKKQQPKWKSPPIDEFLDGHNVSKKGQVYTYEFQYKNIKEGKTCTVVYKEKNKPGGMVESQHKWRCKGKPVLDDDTKALLGEDYE